MNESESYARAVERLHADGCRVHAIDRPRGYESAVVVYAADGSAYRVEPAHDLPTFADADDVQPWALPATCSACGHDLDHVDRDRGATLAYPYCVCCHYAGGAGDHAHADVLAACERLGLRAYVEQTGGGCMNLRVWRPVDGADPSAGPEEVERGATFAPSVVAVGAVRDESGAWAWIDAALPEPGGAWCAWHIDSPGMNADESGPDADTFLPGAEALARYADSIL